MAGYEKDEKLRPSSSLDLPPPPSLHDPHAGLVFPTEEELHSLRRISDSIPWNAYRRFILYLFIFIFFHSPPPVVIAVIELAERFSYYGSSVVFVSPLPSS